MGVLSPQSEDELRKSLSRTYAETARQIPRLTLKRVCYKKTTSDYCPVKSLKRQYVLLVVMLFVSYSELQ